MSEKLGVMIGVVKTTCKTTIPGGASITNTIRIDFSTSSDSDIKNWLASNRVIAGQRPWKGLSEEELSELDGKTFVAQSIGTKVKTRAEQIQALVSAGLPEELAKFSIDNPEKFQAAVDGIEAEVSKPEQDEEVSR